MEIANGWLRNGRCAGCLLEIKSLAAQAWSIGINKKIKTPKVLTQWADIYTDYLKNLLEENWNVGSKYKC